MQRLKVNIDGIDFELESVYNNKRNINQFDIYLDGRKQFAIEPIIIYGHGKEISWQLAEEYRGIKIEHNIIEMLGNEIENNIN